MSGYLEAAASNRLAAARVTMFQPFVRTHISPAPASAETAQGLLRRLSFSRTDRLFVIVLALLSFLSWYPRRQGALDLRWDGSVYYVLGTALAQGKGYSLLNEPGEIRANQYPPLLPLIIAAHQKIARTSDAFIAGPWLKASAIAWSTVVLVAAYVLLRCFLPPLWARCAAIMYLLNLPAYLHFSMVSAELPFTVALLAFLAAHYGLHGARREAAAGAAAAAAFLARSIGVTVYAAWIAEAVFRRQFKTAIIRCLAAAVIVVPWYAYVHSVESSEEYRNPSYAYQRADYMYYNVSYAKNMAYNDPYRPELGKSSGSDVLRRVMYNVALSPGLAGEAVSSYRSFWIGHATSLTLRTGIRLPIALIIDTILFVIGCMALGGIVLLTRRGEYLIGLYIIATVAAVSTTAWPQQYERYISPAAPLLLLGLFIFLIAICDVWTQRFPAARRWVFGAVVCFVALLIVQQAVTYLQSHTKYLIGSDVADRAGSPVVYKQLFYYDENVAMDECITWIAKHSKPTDVVAASMAHWVYLRTGLKTVMPPLEPDGALANSLLDTVPVRYIIRETPSFYASRYVSNAVGTDGAWRLVHVAKATDVRVYERVLRQ